MKNQTIYDALLNAGCDIDHHESDLYVRDTPTSREILRRFENTGFSYSSFLSPKDGQLWFELPFMYLPFWQAKAAIKS